MTTRIKKKLKKQLWVYRTAFSAKDVERGRFNFLDAVLAGSERQATERAIAVVRGMDEQDFGADADADVEIIGPLASDVGTLAEMLGDEVVLAISLTSTNPTDVSIESYLRDVLNKVSNSLTAKMLEREKDAKDQRLTK